MSKSICLKRIGGLMLAMVMLLSLCACQKQDDTRITGGKWLFVQEEQCLPDLQAYSEGMDEVVTLYIMGAITEEDFGVELMILDNQYDLLMQRFQQIKRDNPVKEGGHTYISRRGTEGMEKCYEVFGNILVALRDENGRPLSRDEVAYIYLSFRQDLSDAMATFFTAVAYYEYYGEDIVVIQDGKYQ